MLSVLIFPLLALTLKRRTGPSIESPARSPGDEVGDPRPG
jgi:hypothetical protein